jgi:hypothetical protein
MKMVWATVQQHYLAGNMEVESIPAAEADSMECNLESAVVSWLQYYWMMTPPF